MTATEYVITAGAVAGVAAIAAVASYEHGYALVRANGEVSWTGRLLPLTVDELSYACSMVMLDSGRRRARRVQWLLRQGTLGTDSGAIVVMGQSASRSCPAGTTSPIRRLSPLDPRRRLPLGRPAVDRLHREGIGFCLPQHLESYAADVFGRLAAADRLRGPARDPFTPRWPGS